MKKKKGNTSSQSSLMDAKATKKFLNRLCKEASLKEKVLINFVIEYLNSLAPRIGELNVFPLKRSIGRQEFGPWFLSVATATLFKSDPTPELIKFYEESVRRTSFDESLAVLTNPVRKAIIRSLADSKLIFKKEI